jgi:putative addiction module CopG family antidote
MSVTLSPQTEAEIRRWVDSGQFPDADMAVTTALRLMREKHEEQLAELRELVAAGFTGGNRRELTPELMDEIDRRAEEKFERGEPPARHVCP